MKNLYNIICAVTIIFALSSCVKQGDDLLKAPVTKDASFSSIQVADNFNWSTTNKIGFNFTGSAENEYALVLKVLSPDGNVLFQKLQNANEDFKGTLELPTHYEFVTVSYGSVSKTFDCKNGVINMTIE